jgi:MGT family glycosyltransferase
MARILLASTPVPGHVTPISVLARRLVERGNDVVWYTGAGFADQVTATGARHEPIRHAHDWSLINPHDQVPELRGQTGINQVRTAFRKLFIDAAPAALADLQAITADFDAEVVVANGLVFADRWLHELGGPPNVNIGTTMYGLYSRDTAPFGPALMPNATPIGRVRNRAMNLVHRRLIFGPVNRHLDDTRELVGLPRRHQPVLESFLSDYLYLQDCAESFEYPRSDLPPQVHYIGPLIPDAPARFSPPAWWPEVESGRPVVLVTQGTVRNEDDLLFGPTIEALAHDDVLVIATTAGGPSFTGPVPANVRVEKFVPYAALMPHVSAYVTNGGYGGVQMALSHGVPIVVCGATEDKPEVGARVAWSGAGVRVKPVRPTAAEIRSAVHQVLWNDSYRAQARRIARDISHYDAAGTGSILIEEVARTGRPVVRDSIRYPIREPDRSGLRG